MSESVAFCQGYANTCFTSAGASASLWLGVFNEDPMTRFRVQKTDQPGQSLPRVLIDNGYAARPGSF